MGQERRELLSGEVRKEMKTSSRVLPQPESNVAIRQEVGKGSVDLGGVVSC